MERNNYDWTPERVARFVKGWNQNVPLWKLKEELGYKSTIAAFCSKATQLRKYGVILPKRSGTHPKISEQLSKIDPKYLNHLPLPGDPKAAEAQSVDEIIESLPRFPNVTRNKLRQQIW